MTVDTATAFFADGPIMHAFETGGNNTGITYGVDVQGTRCGVYGESVHTDRDTGRASTVEKVGVEGVGDNIGVLGNGNGAIFGVMGFHNGVVRRFADTTDPTHDYADGTPREGNDAAAVLGAAMRQATGVVGLSLNAVGNPLALSFKDQLEGTPTPGEGTGVLGASGRGVGVRGVSGEGPAMRGTSIDGEGGQFTSESNAGVHGASELGRGGVFESRRAAEVRLVPLRQEGLQPALPRDGRVGDMLLVRTMWRGAEGRQLDQCSLWLCVPASPPTFGEVSDQWQEIMLGTTVTGTL